MHSRTRDGQVSIARGTQFAVRIITKHKSLAKLIKFQLTSYNHINCFKVTHKKKQNL